MESSLGLNIPVEPQPHDRMFRGASALAGASVGDYWRWAYSDIVGNTNRGLLAQFIVAKALRFRWSGSEHTHLLSGWISWRTPLARRSWRARQGPPVSCSL